MLNYYAVSEIGRLSFDQSEKVRSAWNTDGNIGYSNMDAGDIGKVCVDADVPVSMSKTCTDAGSSCKGNKKCEEVFKKYAIALKGGYTKSFEDFVKESKRMGFIQSGLGIVAGFFGDPTKTPDVPTEKTLQEKRLKWGVGITLGVAFVGLGVYLYLKSRKGK